MFKTIVLAMDGSEHAETAVPVAADLARRYGAKIVIAHVDERIVAKGGAPSIRADEDEIKSELRRRAEELTSEGIEASAEFATIALGGPAAAIIEIADRVGGDLIVAGNRGRSAVAGLLVGSVIHRLLHIAKRPVLTIPSTG
jgi:nucleotide-binding universal stress UspA family protein